MLILLAALLPVVACAGARTQSNNIVTSGPNVQPVTVNAGPAGDYVNGIFTSVTVCVPGTSDCQTIGGILVDTGSSGLRLISSASGGALTVPLPQQTDANGNPITECTKFADNSFLWGSVRAADIKLAGEQASSVPVHVAGDPSFPNVPGSCSAGGINENSLQGLGANGILGVSTFQQDCGGGCAPGSSPTPPPATYYVCPPSGCQPTFEGLAQQVQNPVALFPVDNNGVIIELPSVGAMGAPSVSGSLVFGIGTENDNGTGDAAIFTLDPSTGDFATIYNGQTYDSSFIDSGSNAIYFLDSKTTGIATCSKPNNTFYCPPSQVTLPTTNQGLNGTTDTVDFPVANANTLLSSPTAFVFSNLAGPSPGNFDWGLPFFFGRNVFTAIEGKNTPAGPGPYWAY